MGPFAVMALMQGAQTGLNILQGSKNAKAHNAWANYQQQLTLRVAADDAAASYTAIAARRAEESRVNAQTLEMVTKDATRRISSVSVGIGESGLKGNTAALLLDDFGRVALQSQQNILDSERYAQDQYGRDVAAVRSQHIARIYGAQQQGTSGVNFMQEFLDFTAGIMNAKYYADKVEPHGLNGGRSYSQDFIGPRP